MVTRDEAAADLNRNPKTANQQAVVARVVPTVTAKTVRRVIPGGKTMDEQIDERRLPQAVFNWLRHVKDFSAVTVSWAENLGKLTTRESKLQNFDLKDPLLPWERQGKRWLADEIAKAFLAQEGIVAVKATREGLYAVLDTKAELTPESDLWEPYVEFDAVRPGGF